MIEGVLQGEQPKDDLKERVMAALPITLFKKGSLFGAALLGSRSAMTLAVSTTAAVIGTAFSFSVFSGLFDHDARSAIETTTPVRVKLPDRSQPENESAGTKGDGPALTVEDSGPRKQEAKPKRPTIGVAGSATDPVIVINYEVPEESDVEITIRDRVGTVVAVPSWKGRRPAGTPFPSQRLPGHRATITLELCWTTIESDDGRSYSSITNRGSRGSTTKTCRSCRVKRW